MASSPPTPPACPFRTTWRSSEPEDFKLIGTPAKRLDTPAKVNGTAVYGIDVRPPGVKIATLAQSPVFGGRVKSVDDTAARAVNGVRQIVRLDDAVAVVADHMGAAKKGLAALVIITKLALCRGASRSTRPVGRPAAMLADEVVA